MTRTILITGATKGDDVTATLVDISGTPKVVLRGDHSTIHTRDTSFRKAYTVVTMGPIFHFDASSRFAELVSKSPAGSALASTPNVIALASGVAIKAGSEIVAALGVRRAPGRPPPTRPRCPTATSYREARSASRKEWLRNAERTLSERLQGR